MVDIFYLGTICSENNEVTTLTPDSNDLDDRTYQSNVRTSLALIRTIDAEKRTHLAELRTGIGILTIPMSLLTILIATSNYYSISEVLSFIIGLVVGITILLSLGAYFVYSAMKKLRRDQRLRESCEDISCLMAEINKHD